jgi:uncharacterized protein
MVRDLILSKVPNNETNLNFANTVQKIATHVSYSSEIKDPELVQTIIADIPELAIVQDADRLDSIGAIGIGRVFTYGGAKSRGMDNSLAHFDEKLLKIEALMKTPSGKALARERTARLKTFREWWAQESICDS